MRQLKGSGSLLPQALSWLPGNHRTHCRSHLGYSLFGISALDAIPQGVCIRVSLFYIGVINFLVPQILGRDLHAFLHSYGNLYL